MTVAELRSSEELFSAEQAMQGWQAEWDDFNDAAAENRQKSEVEQSKIQHLDEAIERANARLQTLNNDLARLNGKTSKEEIGSHEQMLEVQEHQLERINKDLSELSETIERHRERNKQTSHQLDQNLSLIHI